MKRVIFALAFGCLVFFAAACGRSTKSRGNSKDKPESNSTSKSAGSSSSSSPDSSTNNSKEKPESNSISKSAGNPSSSSPDTSTSNSTDKPESNSTSKSAGSSPSSSPDSPTSNSKRKPESSSSGNSQRGVTAGQSSVNTSFKRLLNDYFKLKNALTADEANNAAVAGQAMVIDFDHFNQSGLSAGQKKTYSEIAEDAREMAEHIGKSADRLPHQREHFDMLSKDMYDLVKLFGVVQPVYVEHCPMYNNRKGAIWLSEVKVIKNPYLGKSMPDCGSLKEILK